MVALLLLLLSCLLAVLLYFLLVVIRYLYLRKKTWAPELYAQCANITTVSCKACCGDFVYLRDFQRNLPGAVVRALARPSSREFDSHCQPIMVLLTC